MTYIFNLVVFAVFTQIFAADDNNGNLYATSASHSQSAATNSGSKDNYVGNIFYDLGVVVITETGSWSGSADGSDGIRYTDIGRTYGVDSSKEKDILTV